MVVFVLFVTGLVVAVVGWGCYVCSGFDWFGCSSRGGGVVMLVLVLTGLVVAVVGWGCYVCSGFDWFGCSSRGVYCLGWCLVWFRQFC